MRKHKWHYLFNLLLYKNIIHLRILFNKNVNNNLKKAVIEVAKDILLNANYYF